MARLLTHGAEMQAIGAGIEGPNVDTTGLTLDTTNPRSGAACYTVSGNSASFLYAANTVAGVSGRSYYARVYFRMSALPVTNAHILMEFASGGSSLARVRVNTDGTCEAVNAAGVAIGSPSSALSVNNYYMIELRCVVGTTTANGTIEARVDGTTFCSLVGSANTGTAQITVVNFGKPSSANTGTATYYFDDFAVNDDQGTAQNSWCGSGKVVLLKPTSDNARVNWKTSAGGTANLFNATKNTPPIGVADASGGITNQIKDITANTTDTYSANLGAYTTAVASGGGGMSANDVVTLVQSVINFGPATAAACQVAQQMTSNPAITETTGAATAATAVGTFPAGWTTQTGTVAYLPGVTPGTSPVMRIRKATSAVTEDIDFMGLLVEYVPLFARQASVLKDQFGGTYTMAVTPVAIGDILILTGFVLDSTGTQVVTGVSGGGVATWNKVIDVYANGNQRSYMWWGIVTATGAQTVTVAGPSSTSIEMVIDEISATGAPQWRVTTTGSSVVASGAAMTFPSLTPSDTASFYYGYGVASPSSTPGTTPGFVYFQTLSSNDMVLWNPTAVNGTAYAPTAVMPAASSSTAVAAIFSVRQSSKPVVVRQALQRAAVR